MKTVLLVQPTMPPWGGGTAVAAWILDSLKGDHSLSLLTLHAPDFAAIDRAYGTRLERAGVTVLEADGPLRRLLARIDHPRGILETCWLFRAARVIGRRFEVLISAADEVDFGRRGIQYIHFPHKRLPHVLDVAWWRVPWKVLTREYQLWMLVSGFSRRRMSENVTLVNSSWTGRKFHELYGVAPLVVEPPVPGDFPDVPWEAREAGFVSIGRFVPEKRHDLVIDVIRRVRETGFDVHLHVVGSRDLTRSREAYEHLLRLSHEHPSWLFLHENVPLDELASLVARHRFGIHGLREEHFGIGTAQMVRAGCIPFVPDGGGQTAVVGDDRRLVYDTVDDAVAKIVRVLADPAEQDSLRASLTARRERHSDDFRRRIREVVAAFRPVTSLP